MRLDELISQVLELDAKATMPPWIVDHGGQFDVVITPKNRWDKKETPDNRKLVHLYRTSAPELARRCKIMKEALEFYASTGNTIHGNLYEVDQGLKARIALADVEKMFEGGK